MSLPHYSLVIMVDSGCRYFDRRHAIRNSWMLLQKGMESPLSEQERQSMLILFVVGRDDSVQPQLEAEMREFGDIIQTPVPDSYDTILAKMLQFLKTSRNHFTFDFFMHADDDSFVRLDLLIAAMQALPRQMLYWGYVWNLPGGPHQTRPLRDPTAKSFMSYEQHPHDFYPPFASGCGFLLSFDLAMFLAAHADDLPPYRLVDAGCGLYLQHIGGLTPQHDERVRPYRPLPMWQPDTIVQHYMKPEEFRGYYQQTMQFLRDPVAGMAAFRQHAEAQQVYDLFARAGVMKR